MQIDERRLKTTWSDWKQAKGATGFAPEYFLINQPLTRV
jgi:hypothetical protein